MTNQLIIMNLILWTSVWLINEAGHKMSLNEVRNMTTGKLGLFNV